MLILNQLFLFEVVLDNTFVNASTTNNTPEMH